MEVSASRWRGVRTPIIACGGLRGEERHYGIAMAGEKSGPTSMTFSRIPRWLCVRSWSFSPVRFYELRGIGDAARIKIKPQRCGIALSLRFAGPKAYQKQRVEE
jgi:hypothetical protein